MNASLPIACPAPAKPAPAAVRYERLDPLGSTDWDAAVTRCADHTPFHRSAWARVLSECYGHRPHYLGVRAGVGSLALVPLMQVSSPITGRRGVSLPFSDFAGPLWQGEPQGAALDEVLREYAAARNWKHLEIRGPVPPPPGAPGYMRYKAHQLDLTPGPEAIEAQLPDAVRRALRKVARGPVEVRVEEGEKALRTYYDLHGRTRRRHGLPPQPLHFFQAIRRHLMDEGLGTLVLARLGRLPLAGAIFLHSGSRAIYKFGASDTAHWSLRPNQAVMWHAIAHLGSIGCRSLHFGRTSDEDEGLSRFKRSWTAIEGPLTYFRYRPAGSLWQERAGSATESHPLVFGRLPLAFNRLAGRLIYPHLD